MDGAWKDDLAGGHRPEAEPAVIGLVANENDQLGATGPRGFQCRHYELAAETKATMVGIYGNRPEQYRSLGAANGDFRRSDRSNDLPAEAGDKAKPRQMPFALAHPIGRSREAPRTENALMQLGYPGDIFR